MNGYAGPIRPSTRCPTRPDHTRTLTRLQSGRAFPMNRKMLALGAGFAVTIAVITAGEFAYVARPRAGPPWNDAFVAKLSDIRVLQTVDSTGKSLGAASLD